MNYIKHPRIYHLPFSPGIGKDDKIIKNLSQFYNNEIVITLKLDGENTNFYKNGYHARSFTWTFHPSRTWIEAYYYSKLQNIIPEGWRICGENMYAKHSIYYKNLESYFYVHSIWNENNICLSWDETTKFCEKNELSIVPTLYMGNWNIEKLEKLIKQQYYNNDEIEGFVIRILDKIPYLLYNECVTKWVRKDHVRANEHWRNKKVEKNLLKEV